MIPAHQTVFLALERHRSAQAAHPQRHHELAVRGQLLRPRRRHIPGSGGDDNPVIWRPVLHPELGVGEHHPHPAVPGRRQAPARAAGDLRVNVDRGDLPGPADKLGHQRCVVPISRHRMPGRSPACSSITACSHGADTELVAAPCASRLVMMGSRRRTPPPPGPRERTGAAAQCGMPGPPRPGGPPLVPARCRPGRRAGPQGKDRRDDGEPAGQCLAGDEQRSSGPGNGGWLLPSPRIRSNCASASNLDTSRHDDAKGCCDGRNAC